jgi:hypothetical protein
VDAVVTRGSPLDAHARTNTTSVYTAAEVFWMLPPKLCTDLTSLNEEQDRLALVMELHVAENGQVMDSLVTTDEVYANPMTAVLPNDPAVCYALTIALGKSRVAEPNWSVQ